MMYCYKCGSELRGAKKFCKVCGARQSEAGRKGASDGTKDRQRLKVEEKSTPDKEPEVETGICYRCGYESDRKCFFCEKFICKDHIKRMQANVASYVDMQHYIKHEDKIRINQGWRGYIINACPRCASIKQGKDLTDDENEKIQTVDICAWYPVDIL